MIDKGNFKLYNNVLNVLKNFQNCNLCFIQINNFILYLAYFYINY
jgi:hypothetical protein